jgi:hypothetical protein
MKESTLAKITASVAVAKSMAQKALAASPNPQWTEYEMRCIDEWIASQGGKLDRSEAIRRLVAKGEGEMTDAKRLPGRLWTAADDEILRSMVQDRMHTRSIGLRLERTPTEIRKRASRLNIFLRQSKPQKQMG